MTKEQAIKYGIILNKVLIIVSAVAWVSWFFIMKVFKNLILDNMLAILYPIIAIIVLILAIIVFLQLRKDNVQGASFLLASAVTMAILSWQGIVLGILVFILSGVSLQKMIELQNNEEIRIEVASN